VKRKETELEAPSRWDESCSRNSLRPSPWVRRRIKELGYEGRLVKHWVPPLLAFAVKEGRNA
jgi:hypothetical protein